MNVVCQNTQCVYPNSAGFCVKDYVFLNSGAMCNEWWEKNGAPRVRDVPVRPNNPPSDKNE